jgi:alkylation response protein AidB-like acyl-CoA dehydrogenase
MFILTPENKALQTLAHDAAYEHINPTIVDDERRGIFRPEIIKKLGALGLTGIPTAEAYGGSGLGYFEYALALSEIARVSTSYAISIAVSGLPQVILSQFGSDTLKKKYIPNLASGNAIGAFSLSESFSGSDAAGLKTKAVKKDGGYVLSGSKLWATQADSALETGVIIVFASTGSGPASQSISAFAIDRSTKGVHIGKQEEKMGLNASHTCEIVLENAFVPADHLVGAENSGFKIAMTALDSGRITIAATAVGLASAALDASIAYAKERTQFGQPIAQFQGIQFMLADMFALKESAKLLVWQAAQLRDIDATYSTEAATAKFFASDAAMKITTDAVQIFGGAGYTQDYMVERLMREAKVLQIVEGTNQIQRMVIGRQLTK